MMRALRNILLIAAWTVIGLGVNQPLRAAEEGTAEPAAAQAAPAAAAPAEATPVEAAPAAESAITDIQWAAGQVTVLGTGLSLPKVSTLPDAKNPSNIKIVLDFQGPSLPKPLTVAGSDAVQKIRAAQNKPGVVRVVLEALKGTSGTATVTETGVVYSYTGAAGSEAQAAAPAAAPAEAAAPAAAEMSAAVPETASSTTSEVSGRTTSRLIGQTIKPSSKGLKVVLTSDGPPKYKIHKLTGPDRVLVLLTDTKMDLPVKSRVLATDQAKAGGLLQVKASQLSAKNPTIATVELMLVPGATFQVDRDANQVVVTVIAPPHTEKSVATRGNLKQRVSVDLEGADLKDVVKALGTEAGFDVDVATDVTGTVNQRLKEVYLDQALAVLLSPGNYRYEVQGNLLRVGTANMLHQSKELMPHITEVLQSGGITPTQLETLVRSILPPTNAVKTQVDLNRNVLILNGTRADVDEFRSAMKELKLDANDTDRITRVIKLNYADPAVVAGLLTPYLTPVGKAQVDTRGQSLVIWETAANMGVLQEVIKDLDVPLQQVLIEGTIVEVNADKTSEMGIVYTVGKGGNTSLSSGLTQTVSTLSNPGNLLFGTLKSGFDISANLTFLEDHKQAKVISRPKIATQNGVEATIETVETVIYVARNETRTPGSDVITVTETSMQMDLPILLTVTPRITEDGRITTAINVSIKSVSGSVVSLLGGGSTAPPTTTQRAKTVLTVKNGETIVIGGLVRDVMTEEHKRIPLLGSLPLLGALFRNTAKENRKVESIIFITPTLIEP